MDCAKFESDHRTVSTVAINVFSDVTLVELESRILIDLTASSKVIIGVERDEISSNITNHVFYSV